MSGMHCIYVESRAACFLALVITTIAGLMMSYCIWFTGFIRLGLWVPTFLLWVDNVFAKLSLGSDYIPPPSLDLETFGAIFDLILVQCLQHLKTGWKDQLVFLPSSVQAQTFCGWIMIPHILVMGV